MMMRGERYQSTRQTRLVAVNLCGAASELTRPALLRTGLLWVRTWVRTSFYGCATPCQSVVPPCPFPLYDGMLSRSGLEKGSASPPVV
jgi:hypothetical protein